MANFKLKKSLKRNVCPITIPQWMIDKLNEDPRPRGRIVEEALILIYGWKDESTMRD